METRFSSAGGTKTDVALFPNESEALSIPTTEPLEQREGSQKQPKNSSLSLETETARQIASKQCAKESSKNIILRIAKVANQEIIVAKAKLSFHLM